MCLVATLKITLKALYIVDDCGGNWVSGDRIIILYSGSTLNTYSLFSQKLWVLLIKLMMGPTTSMRRGSTYLMYSRNT